MRTIRAAIEMLFGNQHKETAREAVLSAKACAFSAFHIAMLCPSAEITGNAYAAVRAAKHAETTFFITYGEMP